jgi:hypothetical protein
MRISDVVDRESLTEILYVTDLYGFICVNLLPLSLFTYACESGMTRGLL